jgi:hypothetical protein
MESAPFESRMLPPHRSPGNTAFDAYGVWLVAVT